MNQSFADRRTQELYSNGAATHFPPVVARRAARTLEYVDLATSLDDLKVPPGIDFMRCVAIGRARMRSP